MPQISKYKAAGKAAGRYKSILSDVAATEYAKAHEKWKSERTKSMIGEVGASVANILGIYDERKKASEFARYKDIAAELPGVLTEEEEYKTAFGKTKTRTVYKSAISGRVIPESMLSMLGMQEELAPGTSAYSDVEKIGKALMKRIPAETFALHGVSTLEEYEEKLGLGEFTEAELLEMEPAEEEILEIQPSTDITTEEKIATLIPEAVEEPYSGIDWETIEQDRLKRVEAERKRVEERRKTYPSFVDPATKEESLIQKEFEKGLPLGVDIDVAIQQDIEADIRKIQPVLDQIGRATTEADLEEHLLSDNEHIQFAAQKRQRELKSTAESLDIVKVQPGEKVEIKRIMESLTKEEKDLFQAGVEPKAEYQYVEGNARTEGSRAWFANVVEFFQRSGRKPVFTTALKKYNEQIEALAREAGWTGSEWEE